MSRGAAAPVVSRTPPGSRADARGAFVLARSVRGRDRGGVTDARYVISRPAADASVTRGDGGTILFDALLDRPVHCLVPTSNPYNPPNQPPTTI